MKRLPGSGFMGLRVSGMIIVLSLIARAQMSAPTPPPGCCTPEATARNAVAAKFIDIGGVKLGTSPEETVAALKALNPGFKIDTQRTGDWDYEAGFVDRSTGDPKKAWLISIRAEALARGSQENFQVHFTTPPSHAFAFYMQRRVTFPQPVTKENVLAGLRKKYGPESFHSNLAENQYDWVFGPEGHVVQGEAARKVLNNSGCVAPVNTLGVKQSPPDLRWNTLQSPSFYRRLSPPYVDRSAPDCETLTFVRAIMISSTGSEYANGVIVAALDHSLQSAGVNTTFAWLNQVQKERAAKQKSEAEKRGAGGIKY